MIDDEDLKPNEFRIEQVSREFESGRIPGEEEELAGHGHEQVVADINLKPEDRYREVSVKEAVYQVGALVMMLVDREREGGGEDKVDAVIHMDYARRIKFVGYFCEMSEEEHAHGTARTNHPRGRA